MAWKILLSGDVEEGSSGWQVLFSRVRKLTASKHGPFQGLFIAGVSAEALVHFESEQVQNVPIPTYFLLNGSASAPANSTMLQKITDSSSDDAPTELAPNFFFLGKSGLRQVFGLQVAFLSGNYDSTAFSTDSPTPHHYTQTQVQKLLQHCQENTKTIDLFLSSEYPKDILNKLSPNQIPDQFIQAKDHIGVQHIRDLAIAAKPRYHIAGTYDTFFQRTPYFNDISKTNHTRFIGLGFVSTSTDKTKKWLHALNLVPFDKMEEASRNQVPAGVCENPFTVEKSVVKRQRTGLSEERARELTQQSTKKANQYFYDPAMAAKGGKTSGVKRQKLQERKDCWFCLATPTLERHLIVSIGTEVYLAIPKGAMVDDHVLIIPICHETDMNAVSAEAKAEIEMYKNALRKLFEKEEKQVLIFDRNVRTQAGAAAHCHLQVIPIPNQDLERKDLVSFFHNQAENYNMAFEELALDQPIEAGEYWAAEVPDLKNSYRRFLHVEQGNRKPYLQFGRHVAATFLNTPERKAWNYCVVSKKEESQQASAFKKKFQAFDFSLQE